MRAKSKRAEIEERRKQVAANLLGGLNYREMAEALGVSLGTIASDVKIIMGRWRREQVEGVGEWVALEDRRLDRLLNAIWEDALAMNFSSIDRVLSIQNQRAKLRGLYAPERREVTGEGGGLIGAVIEVIYVNEDSATTTDAAPRAAPGTATGAPV